MGRARSSSPSLLPRCLYHVAVGRCCPPSHSSVSQLYLHPVSTLRAVARSGGGCWLMLGCRAGGGCLIVGSVVCWRWRWWSYWLVVLSSPVLVCGCPVVQGPHCGQSPCHPRQRGVGVDGVCSVHPRSTSSRSWAWCGCFCALCCCRRACGCVVGVTWQVLRDRVCTLQVPRFTGLPSPPWGRSMSSSSSRYSLCEQGLAAVVQGWG